MQEAWNGGSFQLSSIIHSHYHSFVYIELQIIFAAPADKSIYHLDMV